MCGIAGFMARPGRAAPAGLEARFAAALAHRGPDGEGALRRDNVVLVHRRLAVIDPAGGRQPLALPDGTALVANAELYDYVERRAELGGFATGTDCEVALHLYRRDGEGFADGLRGMYALALHDPARRRLVLARDPFGIKPLYVAETEDGLAFASEAQALAAAGIVAPALAEGARDEVIALQFSTGRATALAGVERVLPGETLVAEDGRIVARRRRAALPAGGPQGWSDEEAEARLDAALTESVALHGRADVPCGLFLSGGTDSAAVLAAMRGAGARVRAYAIGIAGADERAHARRAAAAAGAELAETDLTAGDFWALLPAVAAALDDPAADYAAVPTYKLAALAAREVKVVLTGEGGDELFAGYGRYRAALRPWWQGGRGARLRHALAGLGVLRREPPAWRDGVAGAEALAAGGGRTRLQALQAADVAEWLPNDLLLKLDRCLMAHGLEGRTPFLDPAVAAVAAGLSDRQKVRGGAGKWLLRTWLQRRLPEAAPFARKRGFSVPVGAWIAAEGARLGPLVAAQPGVAAIADPGAVAALFRRAAGRRAGAAAWRLLFYALWHRRHIEGRAAAGDTFAALAPM